MYSMAINAPVRATAPRNVVPAYRTLSQCVIIVPGCITQDRIDISANVIPLEFLAIALRLRTWPRRATNTVTNESSIVFAKAAHNREAVLGASFPGLEVIL